MSASLIIVQIDGKRNRGCRAAYRLCSARVTHQTVSSLWEYCPSGFVGSFPSSVPSISVRGLSSPVSFPADGIFTPEVRLHFRPERNRKPAYRPRRAPFLYRDRTGFRCCPRCPGRNNRSRYSSFPKTSSETVLPSLRYPAYPARCCCRQRIRAGNRYAYLHPRTFNPSAFPPWE